MSGPAVRIEFISLHGKDFSIHPADFDRWWSTINQLIYTYILRTSYGKNQIKFSSENKNE